MSLSGGSGEYVFPLAVSNLSLGSINEDETSAAAAASVATTTGPAPSLRPPHVIGDSTGTVYSLHKSNRSVSSQHLKRDSMNSMNSISSTTSSSPNGSTDNFRLKRFNSASSISTSSSGSTTASSTHSDSISSPPYLLLKKIQKFAIPVNVTLLSNIELSLLFANRQKNNKGVEEDYFESNKEARFLVIDVRLFIEFSKSHIENAINFNLPSTLLKRSNFSLEKCINNLSKLDNAELISFLAWDGGKIILYDDLEITNNEILLSVYGLLNKFIQYKDWNGELCVLKNGFQSFRSDFPDLTTSLNTNPIGSVGQDEAELESPCMLSSHSRSMSLASITTVKNQSLNSPALSPNLSRFQLPKIPKTPVFKIRQNEERIVETDEDSSCYGLLHEFKYLETSLSSSNVSLNFLPAWFQSLMHRSTASSLFQKFKSLEIEERKRLNSLISSNSICSGIELGYKNRYKDIFPYEHSRVRLPLTPNSSDNCDNCDLECYINANQIKFPEKFQYQNTRNLSYIATQAPLFETVGDFARLCYNERIKLVINLTNQFENGVEKCYPYWNDERNFKKQETLSDSPNTRIRRLSLSKYNWDLIQLQVLNWGDFDVMEGENQLHVLKLIYLKQLIMRSIGSSHDPYSVLVHCSAGCGRTGAFCTIDSIINSGQFGGLNKYFDSPDHSFKFQKAPFDPIYETVENFRDQRISMVQNLRQYLFIYDCLINYYKNFNEGFSGEIFEGLKSLKILQKFINDNR